jgi:hypothetical protein
MVHHRMSKYQWCPQIWICRLDHHCHYALEPKETYKISNCEYVKTLLGSSSNIFHNWNFIHKSLLICRDISHNKLTIGTTSIHHLKLRAKKFRLTNEQLKEHQWGWCALTRTSNCWCYWKLFHIYLKIFNIRPISYVIAKINQQNFILCLWCTLAIQFSTILNSHKNCQFHA